MIIEQYWGRVCLSAFDVSFTSSPQKVVSGGRRFLEKIARLALRMSIAVPLATGHGEAGVAADDNITAALTEVGGRLENGE